MAQQSVQGLLKDKLVQLINNRSFFQEDETEFNQQIDTLFYGLQQHSISYLNEFAVQEIVEDNQQTFIQNLTQSKEFTEYLEVQQLFQEFPVSIYIEQYEHCLELLQSIKINGKQALAEWLDQNILDDQRHQLEQWLNSEILLKIETQENIQVKIDLVQPLRNILDKLIKQYSLKLEISDLDEIIINLIQEQEQNYKNDSNKLISLVEQKIIKEKLFSKLIKRKHEQFIIDFNSLVQENIIFSFSKTNSNSSTDYFVKEEGFNAYQNKNLQQNVPSQIKMKPEINLQDGQNKLKTENTEQIYQSQQIISSSILRQMQNLKQVNTPELPQFNHNNSKMLLNFDNLENDRYKSLIYPQLEQLYHLFMQKNIENEQFQLEQLERLGYLFKEQLIQNLFYSFVIYKFQDASQIHPTLSKYIGNLIAQFQSQMQSSLEDLKFKQDKELKLQQLSLQNLNLVIYLIENPFSRQILNLGDSQWQPRIQKYVQNTKRLVDLENIIDLERDFSFLSGQDRKFKLRERFIQILNQQKFDLKIVQIQGINQTISELDQMWFDDNKSLFINTQLEQFVVDLDVLQEDFNFSESQDIQISEWIKQFSLKLNTQESQNLIDQIQNLINAQETLLLQNLLRLYFINQLKNYYYFNNILEEWLCKYLQPIQHPYVDFFLKGQQNSIKRSAQQKIEEFSLEDPLQCLDFLNDKGNFLIQQNFVQKPQIFFYQRFFKSCKFLIVLQELEICFFQDSAQEKDKIRNILEKNLPNQRCNEGLDLWKTSHHDYLTNNVIESFQITLIIQKNDFKITEDMFSSWIQHFSQQTRAQDNDDNIIQQMEKSISFIENQMEKNIFCLFLIQQFQSLYQRSQKLENFLMKLIHSNQQPFDRSKFSTISDLIQLQEAFNVFSIDDPISCLQMYLQQKDVNQKFQQLKLPIILQYVQKTNNFKTVQIIQQLEKAKISLSDNNKLNIRTQLIAQLDEADPKLAQQWRQNNQDIICCQKIDNFNTKIQIDIEAIEIEKHYKQKIMQAIKTLSKQDLNQQQTEKEMAQIDDVIVKQQRNSLAQNALQRFVIASLKNCYLKNLTLEKYLLKLVDYKLNEAANIQILYDNYKKQSSTDSQHFQALSQIYAENSLDFFCFFNDLIVQKKFQIPSQLYNIEILKYIASCQNIVDLSVIHQLELYKTQGATGKQSIRQKLSTISFKNKQLLAQWNQNNYKYLNNDTIDNFKSDLNLKLQDFKRELFYQQLQEILGLKSQFNSLNFQRIDAALNQIFDEKLLNQQNYFVSKCLKCFIVAEFSHQYKNDAWLEERLSELIQNKMKHKFEILFDNKQDTQQVVVQRLQEQFNQFALDDPVQCEKFWKKQQQNIILKYKLIKPEILKFSNYFTNYTVIINIIEFMKKKDINSNKEIQRVHKQYLMPIQQLQNNCYKEILKQYEKFTPVINYRTNIMLAEENMTEIYQKFKFPTQPIETLSINFSELIFQNNLEMDLGLLKQQKNEAIKKWVRMEIDFSELSFIFFDLLNRAGDWEILLQEINKELINIQFPYLFNKKTLIYLYLSNCDQIRKYKGIQAISKYNPVPLIFPEWPAQRQFIGYDFQQFQKQTDDGNGFFQKRIFNKAIYMIASDSVGILSFGIGKASQKAIGKSSMLNYVFDKKFQENDHSPFSVNTIDIDFDQQFYPTRNWCIADVSGELNQKYYKSFFNLFQLVIIHIHFKDILTSQSHQLQSQILKELQQQQTQKEVKLIVLIRDFTFYDDIQQLIETDQQKMKEKILPNQNSLIQYENVYIIGLGQLHKTKDHERLNQAKQMLKDTIFKFIEEFKVQKISKESLINLFSQYRDEIDGGIEDIQTAENYKRKFMACLKESENDFFSDQILPMRKSMQEQKQLYDKIKITQENSKLQVLNKEVQQLKEKQKNILFSKIMRLFTNEILSDQYWYIIILEISSQIKIFSDEKLKQFKIQKDTKTKQKEEIQQEINKSIEEENSSKAKDLQIQLQRVDDQLKKIQEDVEKQIISIEIFWRELITISQKNQDTQSLELKFNPLDKVYDFLHYGENFELIDGDNMEFCSEQLKYLFNKFENENVFIISVLGPQSSGKSTLLNYIFGCQFFSSVGRCTRGVYGSLLKVNHKHFSYILILDTEGLQDPAKPNSEFDKKIVMFCVSVSQIILINVKSEISQQMRQLLEICIYSMRELKRNKVSENQAFIIFNQNPNGKNDFITLKDQINKMRSDINSANQKQASKEADMLGQDGNVVVLGGAFNVKSDQQNLKYQMKEPQTSFANDIAELSFKIFKVMSKSKSDYNLSTWLPMAQGTWEFISTFDILMKFDSLIDIQYDNQMLEFVQNWKTEKVRENPLQLFHRFLDEDSSTRSTGGNTKLQQIQKGKEQEKYDFIKKRVEGKITDYYDHLQYEGKQEIEKLCDDKQFSKQLRIRHEEQLKRDLQSLQYDSIFNLNNWYASIIGNLNKKDQIFLIEDTIQKYKEKYPKEEIEQFYYLKNKKNLDLNLIQDKERLQLVNDWATKKFEELWSKVISNLEAKLELDKTYTSILDSLNQYYRTHYYSITENDIIFSIKQILIKTNFQEKLDQQENRELINYFIDNLFINQNKYNQLFRGAPSIKQELSLVDKANYLEKHGKYLSLGEKIEITIEQNALDTTRVSEALNCDIIYNLINMMTSKFYIGNSTEHKQNQAKNVLIGPINKKLQAIGMQLNQKLIDQIIAVVSEKYPFESTRIVDIIKKFRGFKEFENKFEDIADPAINMNLLKNANVQYQAKQNSDIFPQEQQKISQQATTSQQKPKHEDSHVQYQQYHEQGIIRYYNISQIADFNQIQQNCKPLLNITILLKKIYKFSYKNAAEKQKQHQNNIEQFQRQRQLNSNIIWFSKEDIQTKCNLIGQDMTYQQQVALDYLAEPNYKQHNKSSLNLGLGELSKRLLQWDKIFSDVIVNLEKGLELPTLQTREKDQNNQNNQEQKQQSWKYISAYSKQTATQAFIQVESVIQNINKDVEYLGQELDAVGKKVIHTFGMWICWRILSFFYKNNSQSNIVELQSSKSEWLKYFIAEIQQDQNQISQSIAYRIATQFYKQLLVDYTNEAEKKCKSQLKNIEIQFQPLKIIQETDKTIFEKEYPTQKEFDATVMQYIKSPKSFLEETFDKQWQNITQQTIKQLNIEYKSQIQKNLETVYSCLQQFKFNLQGLGFVEDITSFTIFDLFDSKSQMIQLATDQKTKYKQLFSRASVMLIKTILLSTTFNTENWLYKQQDFNQEFLKIKKTYSQKNISQTQPPSLFIQTLTLLDQDESIKLEYPMIFVEYLIEKFQELIQQPLQELDTPELKLDTLFQECRNSSLGCQEQCKFCGRKCEELVLQNHQHNCKSTHFIRGMNGIRIQNTLSDRLCDEIYPQAIITILDQQKIPQKRTWKQLIELNCKGWKIGFFSKEEKKYNINFTKFWNSYGKMFCQIYKNDQSDQLDFNSISLNQQKNHYIMCLDDSGSMQGTRWDQAKSACVTYIQNLINFHLQNKTQGYMTIIKFNGSSKVVIGANGPEALNANLVQQQLQFEGGNTNFFLPLQDALNSIRTSSGFNKWRAPGDIARLLQESRFFIKKYQFFWRSWSSWSSWRFRFFLKFKNFFKSFYI